MITAFKEFNSQRSKTSTVITLLKELQSFNELHKDCLNKSVGESIGPILDGALKDICSTECSCTNNRTSEVEPSKFW